MKTQNFYKKFVDFSRNTGIPVKNIIDLIIVLGEHGPIDNPDLPTQTGLSKTSIISIEKEFYSLFRPISNKTDLTDNGKRVYMYLRELFPSYSRDLFEVSLKNNSLHSNYADQRPSTERDFDQFLATTETIGKRTQLMDILCDIKDKKILFLGDDDFTSIEVATYSPERIAVADIDNRILKGIENISNQEKLGIETVKYDARQSMAKDLWNQFDVVFTDPPYTVNGFNLFLARAIDALDQTNKSGRIYICFGHSDLSKERFIPIAEAINKSGLMLRYTFNKFNRYKGAESIGSNSDLYICEVTAKTAPILKGNYKENIYTNEY